MVFALGVVIGYVLVGVVVFLIGARFDESFFDPEDELPVVGLMVMSWPAHVLLTALALPVLAIGWLARRLARR